MRFVLLVSLILTFFSLSAGISGDYQKVRIYLNSSADLDNIARLGIDFEGSVYKKNTFIDLQISSEEKRKLENAGYSTELLIEDLEQFYASRLVTRSGEGFGYGSMGGNYTFTEVLDNLDSLIAQYPNLVSAKDTIGQSILGKPIVAVKISDNPNIQENEPEVLFTGLHHAREPVSMMNIVYYMWWLVENYGTDPQATYLVDNRQMWFVPVVNPDGYVRNQQTNPNGGGMWRLNARDNNDNGVYFESGQDGVDLNRNYGYQWGYNNSGSSPYPGDETYRGPYAFSEVEPVAIRNFCNLHQFRTAFNYHTYSNLLIHPWAYNDSPTPDHNLFHTFGLDLIRFNGYTLGTPSQTVGYSVNGDSNDWMYGEQTSKPKIIAFTPEVGNSSDGFWPPTSRIMPLILENLYPNIVLSYIAGSFPKLYENNLFVYGFNNYVDPGEVVEVTPAMTNFGLNISQPLTLQIIPVSGNVEMINSQVSFFSMNTFDSLTAANPWKLKVNYQTAVGSKLNFQILIFENGNLVNTDSLAIPVGTYSVALAADAENGMTQMTTGGTGGTWGTTTGSSHSPSHSYTDSPSGSYGNSVNYWMRTSTIDLSSAQQATLHYWTKWDIEAGWDYGLVEISTNNGITWNNLVGQYMTAASGQGVQTTGLFGYDGSQPNWVQESFDLAAYAGQQVQIRFRLASDSWVTGDGWYLDDIQLEILDANANIPPYISSVSTLGTQSYTGTSYPVSAVIYDDHGLDHTSLFYSVDAGSSFAEIPMSGSDTTYSALIPPLSAGATVDYYVQTWDTAGASSLYPYDGSHLTFNIIGNTAFIVVDPPQLVFNVPQNGWQQLPLRILNPGTDPATFSITDTSGSTIFKNIQNLQTEKNLDGFREILISKLKHTFSGYIPPQYSAEQVEPKNPENLQVVVITDPAGDVTLPGVDILSVDYSEGTFNYNISMTFSGSPDPNSIGIVTVDLDQNFGTGSYPAPSGYGIGNFDLGSEYEIIFDFANIIGDSLGLEPSVFVVDPTFNPVALPATIQFNGNQASASILKFPAIFDGQMNLGATMLQLAGASLPDLAPDYGHGNYGGELGSSWITELNASSISSYPITGNLNPGDTTTIFVKVAGAYPLGNYAGKLLIENNGPTSPLEVPVNMQISAPGVPNILIDPLAISDTIDANGGYQDYTLNISNSGTGILVYTVIDSIYNGADWLSLSTTFGSVDPGEAEEIILTIDPAAMSPNVLYRAQLKFVSNDPSNPEVFVQLAIFASTSTGISQNETIPTKLALYRNYPNPFNPVTNISFDLPQTMKVKLDIFNILGQRVITLVNGDLPAGHYQYLWDARSEKGAILASGIYFYRLTADNQVFIQKMLLSK